MPENRYFIDAPFAEGQTLSLPPEELRHLKVLRRSSGDSIELVNGRNQLAKATLENTSARITSLHTESPPARQIILAQALLKPKNLDLVIEKGTELGVTSFWLFPGDKSEKKDLSPTQTNRLSHLTISALKQSGRLDLPQIEIKGPIASWKKISGEIFYGDLNATSPLSPSPSSPQIMVIGPESGFSPGEIAALQALGAQGVRLAPHILRAETASICAISQIVNI